MHMHVIHMDCPRCGGRQSMVGSREAVCEYCNINMPLFAKSRDMSDAHYDRGLELANMRNLTASIEELQAALHINRKNIRARNLLGLCYYAMGRVGEALREWVFSANYGTDDNLAQDYLEKFQNNQPYLDKYNDALYNYNEALQFMVEYNEDLAAIRLKRAIEINPDFVDALNLLALFYIRTGDRANAGILAERVLAIDVGNPFARRYYREVFQKKVPPAKKLRAQADEAAVNNSKRTAYEKTPMQKSERQNPFYVQSSKPVIAKVTTISGLLLFVAGLAAMFLFMYILVMPSTLEDSIAENAALSAELSNRQTIHAAQLAERDDIISDLRDELEAYQLLATEGEDDAINLRNENWVNNAYIHLSRELPNAAQAAEAALLIIDGVVTSRLSADALSRYNHVRRTAEPIVEANYLQLGESYFNAGNYDEARRNLERAARLRSDESVVAHYVIYLLGRIAEVEEDFSLARIYYEEIINEFPGSNRVTAATSRLNQLP